jgi:iron-sulfur cluster assembly protein
VLVLSDSATEAIEGILAMAPIPDGAGVRIAPALPSNGSAPADLQLTVAMVPAEKDEVIEEGGARVFVDEHVVEFLDDKVLEAQIVDERVNFLVGEQA